MVAEIELRWGGAGLVSPVVDLILTLFNLGASGLYLHVAIGVFYGARGVARIAKAAGLAIVVLGITLGYRFVVFLVTLYSV